MRTRDSDLLPRAEQEKEGGSGAEWAPAQAMYEDLPSIGHGEHQPDAYPDDAYSELIFLLSHLRFEPDEAKRHWDRILEHRRLMQDRLESFVDVRIALVSYFLQIHRKLENPKVIELQLFQETQASAYRDELTGLYNYRFLEECLARETERAKRQNTPLSLLMVDIDDFKHYNDRNGHEAGNRALADTASLLSEALRNVDFPTRYGGEEFALVLPSTPKIGARLVAERARRMVERHTFPNQESQPAGNLTVSIGVATFPADAGGAAGDLVNCADRAIYEAKEKGKNQVRLYAESSRSYDRVDAAVEGRLRVLGAKEHPLTTVKLSEGGTLFHIDREFPVESFVEVRLALPESDREITACGRVVSVKSTSGGMFETAMSITNIGTRDRDILRRYLGRDVRASGRPDVAKPASL